MRWLIRIVKFVPAAIFTSAGRTIGTPPGAGACTGWPEASTCPAVTGCPVATGAVAGVFAATPAAGVTVVVTACAVCPGAGGCTVVVVTFPLLSVETTCCACPLAAACFLAASIAASSFDLQPASIANASIIVAATVFPEYETFICGVLVFVRNLSPHGRQGFLTGSFEIRCQFRPKDYLARKGLRCFL
jgi:hypothetical protein